MSNYESLRTEIRVPPVYKPLTYRMEIVYEQNKNPWMNIVINDKESGKVHKFAFAQQADKEEGPFVPVNTFSDLEEKARIIEYAPEYLHGALSAMDVYKEPTDE